MYFAGIDEAGFGPTLGPLIITGVLFRAPSREAFLKAVAEIRHRGYRLDDSKAIYRSHKDFDRLSATVLPVLCAFHNTAWDSLATITDRLAVNADYAPPFYLREALAPDIHVPGQQANGRRIADVLRKHDVALACVASAVLPAQTFNARMARLRNKSLLLFHGTAEVLKRLIDATDADREFARVALDKQGGRAYYADLLSTEFPDLRAQIISESAEESVYRMTGDDREIELRFAA